jgi:hypothetical protein
MPREKQTELVTAEQSSGYDFRRCKLCSTCAASPKYKLKKTTVYACAACDFHFINHLDFLPHESPPLDKKAWDYIAGRLPASEAQLRKNLLLIQRHTSLSGAHCLDIGAGAGVFAQLLAESGAVVQGIEPQGIFRELRASICTVRTETSMMAGSVVRGVAERICWTRFSMVSARRQL